jgi:hypothetical protein
MNVQDFDGIALYRVNNDVRHGCHCQFARAPAKAGSATIGEGFKGADVDRQRRGRFNGCALNLEHSFKAGVHFFFFDELSALSGGYPFFDGGKEAGFSIKVSGNDISHHALRVSPGFRGNLGEPRLLWCEMHFHPLKIPALTGPVENYFFE